MLQLRLSTREAAVAEVVVGDRVLAQRRVHKQLLHKLCTGQKKGGREMTAMAIIDETERAEPETNNSWLSISIFHDLRNPLATIYAAAEMLMDLDPEPTEVKRLATNMYCAAGRMRKLLADLRSVASGNRSTTEICDIRDVILAASEAASAGIGNQGVEIVLDMPRKIELPLMCSRLERLFFNLITNALEAMPSGGQIHIRAKTAGDYVLVEIEDTGPGIPLGIRGRLFEPFVTAGKRDGLGLGLALARQTVLDHGGLLVRLFSTTEETCGRSPPLVLALLSAFH